MSKDDSEAKISGLNSSQLGPVRAEAINDRNYIPEYKTHPQHKTTGNGIIYGHFKQDIEFI